MAQAQLAFKGNVTWDSDGLLHVKAKTHPLLFKRIETPLLDG